MSSCNHCGRYTANSKLGEDCKFCKEVYAQGVADGMRKREDEHLKLRELLTQIEWVADSGLKDYQTGEWLRYCPKCASKEPTHETGCALDAAIKRK